jgi:hypothetical protein
MCTLSSFEHHKYLKKSVVAVFFVAAADYSFCISTSLDVQLLELQIHCYEGNEPVLSMLKGIHFVNLRFSQW